MRRLKVHKSLTVSETFKAFGRKDMPQTYYVKANPEISDTASAATYILAPINQEPKTEQLDADKQTVQEDRVELPFFGYLSPVLT